MVRTGYVPSGGCTVQRLAERSDRVFGRKLERERGRWRRKEETLPRKPHDSIKRAMIFLCFLFSSFLSFTQYSSLDRKRSLPRQRISAYSPLKFLVETFLFSPLGVFSSRPIKSLIVTPLFAIALTGIRIGRILREKEGSHPLLGSVSHSLGCLDAPAVFPTRQLLNSRLMTHRARSIQPKFPEISVQNSMDRFGPTGKVSKKRVHLLRWTTFPGRTGWNFG